MARSGISAGGEILTPGLQATQGLSRSPAVITSFRHVSITKFNWWLDSENARLLRMLRQFFRAGALLAVCLSCVASAQQVPCKPTIVGALEIVPLTSRIFHNKRSLRVWLPPGYDPSQKYPVLYILDGASAFDVCASYNHEEMHADETLTELITTGKIPPLIAVGIDNGSDVIRQGDGDGNARAREFLPYPDPYDPATLAPSGSAYPDFLESEVMPAIVANYPVEVGPEHTAIWGASYGGTAALYTLIHRPDLFGSAIIESPGLEVGNGQLLRDTEFLIRTPSRIAVGAGTAEDVDRFGSNAAYLQMVQRLVQNLKAAYLPGKVQLTITEGGHHNYPTFGERFAAGLLFLYGESPLK
jgi:predicted alpha/beta superfamily hydrolase